MVPPDVKSMVLLLMWSARAVCGRDVHAGEDEDEDDEFAKSDRATGEGEAADRVRSDDVAGWKAESSA